MYIKFVNNDEIVTFECRWFKIKHETENRITIYMYPGELFYKINWLVDAGRYDSDVWLMNEKGDTIEHIYSSQPVQVN